MSTTKVTSLDAAIARYVKPAMTLHLAFGDARPNAAVREVVRRFRGTSPEFTVVTSGLLSTQQALVGAGLVRRLVTSFAGENYPVPQPSAVIRRALDDGSLRIEDASLYTLVARLAAGALGVPFFPVRSFADGSMTGRDGMAARARVADPFTGDVVTVVPALTPDLSFIHGVLGDEDGNIVLAGPTGEREWGVLASRGGAIATVERIVDRETLRRHNAVVRIPGAAVAAVCEVPGGSHPYGSFTAGLEGVPGYDEDPAFMARAREAMADNETFDSWISEWLDGSPAPAGHPPEEVPPPATYTDSELMVVSAARQITHRLRDGDFRMLLAGIGQANLATWLARDLLVGSGENIELLAEMGMVGYQPQPGDPYIFSNRNKPTSAQLTDTMAVLGAYVGHPRMPTLAVVGAGQIDVEGNINSSVGFDGRYLTGSGGVNDIASVAAELMVVLRQSPSRLVDRVAVRTAPGRAVRTIVTDRAVFERDRRGFRLVRVLVPAGSEQTTVELAAEVRRRTGWSAGGATSDGWTGDVTREPPPTPAELGALRAYDPNRHFLR